MVRITDEFRRSPLWELVVATARLEQGRRAVEAHAQLGIADLRLLWLLSSEGQLTMKGISEALHLEQSTVNRQVNAALKNGLVERVEQPGATARVVRATVAGEEFFSADLRVSMSVLEAGLAAVPPAEAEAFVRHLGAFAAAYRDAAEALDPNDG